MRRIIALSLIAGLGSAASMCCLPLTRADGVSATVIWMPDGADCALLFAESDAGIRGW